MIKRLISLILFCTSSLFGQVADRGSMSSKETREAAVVAYSTTLAFDGADVSSWKITLTGNVTSSTIVNHWSGQTLRFFICQDAVGGRTFVWPTEFTSPPAIHTTPSVCRLYMFASDGVNITHIELSAGGGSVSSVFGRTGAVVAQAGDYSKSDVGLGNVDNTSDANKPISTATQSALDGKAALADIFPSNGILLIVSGTCPIGFSEEASLDGKFLLGTLAAHADVGGTGGANSVTPVGTVSQPTFTGDALATHTHTFTGSALSSHSHTFTGSALSGHAHTFTGSALGTHTHTFTGDALGTHLHTLTPAGTIAWPAGVPTNATESAHTHGGPTITWPAGVPTIAWPAGVPTQAGHTHDSHTMTASGSSGATRASAPVTHSSVAPVISWPAGVPTATWPAGVPTNGATGTGSAHGHTISWPAGVPTFTGTASQNTSAVGAGTPSGTNAAVSAGTPAGTLDSVSAGTPAGTNSSDSAGTPAGTNASVSAGTPSGVVSQPTFTGASQENRPAFVKVIFCKKN